MTDKTISRQERLAALTEYVENTKRVLTLSSPRIDGIDSAETYRLTLQEAFTGIGALSVRNNEILDTFFYPLVKEDRLLTPEEAGLLLAFTALLTDTTNMEHQDQALIQLQAESMVRAADERDDLREKVLARDNLIVSSYIMFNMLARLFPDTDVCFRYRDTGLAAGKRLLNYLEPGKFLSLPDDECRELVLINARYIRCLFEWMDQEDNTKQCEQDLEMMRRALALAYDPFYLNAMPDYMWESHIFRTLQYLSDFPEYHNRQGFSQAQLEEICTYSDRLCDYLEEHPSFEEGCPRLEREFYRERNAFLAGRLTLPEHIRQLESFMSGRDVTDYSARGMLINFVIPFEYMQSVDRSDLGERETSIINSIYADIAGYVYRLPKTGVFSFMLTYLADYLRNYIEIPGGIPFSDMCLKLIAAMHPPTYVHTLNVANLSRTIAEALLEAQPELFTGVLDTADAEEVKRRTPEILEFVYNASLLHDIGKLFIVETIMTYGRRLLDDEFLLIKAHTLTGASLLSQHESTKHYAEMALGHHKWYDDSAGYPSKFTMAEAKNRTVISVVAVADCLDAATDSVGRSYKTGKTLEGFIGELREGSGTRYAPFLLPLFEDDAFCERVHRVLNEGREQNYRKAYRMLKEL